MKFLKHLVIPLAAGISSLASVAIADEPPVQVTLDAQHPGAAIAPDFAGLSFEVSLLLPSDNGVHYFRPDNGPLIRLFHTLGIKSLRIGGNTSDRDVRRLPDRADLDSLYEFAKAAEVKVIYCLRLHNGDPQEDAATAKYIMDHYAAQVDCFSIGQEPSAYPVEKVDRRPNSERMGASHEKYRYADYAKEWKRFADIISAAVPNIKFCGPSVHNNADWARRFMADFAQSNHVALITEHLYAGGAGGKVPTPEMGRDRMLSTNFTRVYQRLHDGFVPQAISNGLPYRLEEVNNYFNGGAKDVSNTFASALWGLDFMYWWAAHDAAGLNFHTGDRVAAGYTLQPSKYTAFFSTATGYNVRPLGYGIKAFALGSHGRFLSATSSAPDDVNLDIYAVLGEDGNVYCTLINKEHGTDAVSRTISLSDTGHSFRDAEEIRLTAPENDVAATNGVTLGGAPIQEDGSWAGAWKSVPAASAGNEWSLEMPPASAVVLKFSRR